MNVVVLVRQRFQQDVQLEDGALALLLHKTKAATHGRKTGQKQPEQECFLKGPRIKGNWEIVMDLVIEEILHKLKNNEITISSIPEEYSDNPCIVNFEREAGLRVTGKRGFDIISDSFFVEEKFFDPGKTRPTSEKMIRFTRFADYYDYLQGDVYENACYSFHHIPQDELAALNIDSAHLAERTSFIEFSIDDYLSIPTKFDIDDYKTGERIYKHCKWWIEKFNSCSNCSELIYITEKYEKSKLANIIDLTFFFHYYLFAEPDNEKRVSTILDYISTGRYPTVKIVYGLCFVVPPNDVWQAYEKSFNSKSKTTYYRYKERFMEFVKQKEADKIKFHNRGYFDKNSHFYCEETRGLFSDGTQTEVVTYRRYFETFDEFTTYRKGNLANCDLRDAIFLDVDFSKYTRNLLTRLPISINSEDTYSQKAFYREGYFFV